MKIDLLGLFTDRFEEMKRFYAEVLGFETGAELEKYVEFSGQGVRFAICERQVMVDTIGEEHFGRPAEGKPVSLAFRCGDPEEVAADYAKLIERGATAIQGPATMPCGGSAPLSSPTPTATFTSCFATCQPTTTDFKVY